MRRAAMLLMIILSSSAPRLRAQIPFHKGTLIGFGIGAGLFIATAGTSSGPEKGVGLALTAALKPAQATDTSTWLS